MTLKKLGIGTFLVIAGLALALFLWMPRPTGDPAALQAIKAESEALMVIRPGEPIAILEKAEYPPAIARLGPESVFVTTRGVDIMMRSNPDGGAGYFIPRGALNVPKPGQLYRSLGEGVYWYNLS